MENTNTNAAVEGVKMNKMKLDTMPLLGMKRKPAIRRRRHGALGSRCSYCNEGVQFRTYKALGLFVNQGRVCDACVARNLAQRALAEDTFARIEKSVEARDAFARKFGGSL